jgi:uncharacterized membrane protein YbhN (UPF0104 family)
MTPEKRKKLWFVVNAALALAIMIGVGVYFAATLSDSKLDLRQLSLRVELLVPAGLLYLLAHCCWGSFWVRLLHGQGIRVSWFAGLRAYFVSQFGKYVPGKAWVVLMRVGMLRHDAHAHPIPVAVTAVYETLCSMAAGALIGVLLLPYLGVLPDVVSDKMWIVLAFPAIPVALGVLNKYAARVVAKRRGPDARPLPAPSVFLLAQGLLHGACGHCLLGVSLWLTIRSVLPESPGIAETLAGYLAANAIAYVIGFAVPVAGGLGPREFVLSKLLESQFVAAMGKGQAAAVAIVIALVLRLVWTIAEVILAATLYCFKPPAAPIPHHTHHPELLDAPEPPRHAP